MTDDTIVKLIECPRDAMQGWPRFIPTEQKVQYLNALLTVGFDTLDFGSFVSPKAIPQMADTAAVIPQLDLSKTSTRLLAIVANVRGAEQAVQYDEISYLGFPFSVSPVFQQRNTNSTIEESLARVEAIQQLCIHKNKQLVIYISMAFGNPYGDAYNEEIVFDWINKMQALGITIVSLADTVGVATPQQVLTMTEYVVQHFPGIETGVHLHSTPFNREAKMEAALQAGCRRFDGALNGIGGCPMANDELVGNMDTVEMIRYFDKKKLTTGIQEAALENCVDIAHSIFI
ncbi:MAG: hydroxymethylglutaryl-CoA lyase [Chitinophagaceae bacterium]|nr:hydroxymethylglutaryl-CoA lyase [Chitinophagaceae bacterium]